MMYNLYIIKKERTMYRNILLLLPVLWMVTNNRLHAEHIDLPTLSVGTSKSESAPYTPPSALASTSDVGALFKRLPGVNINRNGAMTGIAQYRGLFGNRVNVLINGIRPHAAGPNSMDSALSYLPAPRTHEVSVYRGIAPVSTGIETIGGTITANTKQYMFGSDDDPIFYGNSTAGYSDNGDTRYFALTSGITNQYHRLQIAGNSSRGNDVNLADNRHIKSSEHDQNSLDIHYAFRKSDKELEVGVTHHDTGKTGTAALPMDIMYIRGENYQFAYQQALNNGGMLSGQLTFQDTKHQMNNFTLRNTRKQRQRFAVAKVKAHSLAIKYTDDDWLFGLNIDQADHDTTVFNPNMAAFFINTFKNVARDRYSVFAEWQQAASNWRMRTGTRYSLIKMDTDKVGSFAGLPAGVTRLRNKFNAKKHHQDEHLIDLATMFTYNLSDKLDFEIGLARKTRAPSYQERYLWLPLESTGGLADGNNYIGDVNLDPETAYQLELGLDWHTQKLELAPRAFYHKINDYIQGRANITDPVVIRMNAAKNNAPPLQFSNVDAKIYGFDMNWLIALSNKWQLDGTLSYVRGKRRDTSDNLYRIAPFNAHTTLSYIKGNWTIAAETDMVAKQRHISSENNEKKTSGYALFNVSANYDFSANVSLSGSIDNLFDKRYKNHLAGYNRISDNPDIARGERLSGKGRSINFNIAINW